LVPGETLLVTAGTSGVGIAAIQVGLALGASVVYATTRSYDKADVLKRLGATPIVVGTEASDYPAALEKASQHKVDVVVDLVGGAVAQYLLNVLSPYGRFVSVGRSDFSHASIDLDEVARKNLIILGRSYRTRTPQQTIECITSFEEQLGPALIKGTLKPIVDRCFPLYKIEEAISYMRLNRHIGKIAITVG
jgi:NADPH2:quinone reductase